MIFKWLKKLFGLYDSSPTEIPVNGEPKPSVPKSLCDELDKRKEHVKQNRDKLKQSPTDWYSLNIPSPKDELQTRVFSPRKFENIPSLQTLKDERLRKEAHELKVREERTKSLLDKLETLIAQRKFQEAKQIMDEITHEIVRIKDSVLRKRYTDIQKSLSELERELEHERLVKLAEEQKRKEEEERKKREREEKERVENEKRIAEERIRKQQEANRLAEEARKKEQAELAEKERLEVLSTERKENWSDFKQILDNNGIRYLYHFTDRRNIPSIKRHGGLFSWQYCDTHGITIPSPGGIGFGRNLDLRYGLEDYVRLSFCNDHPMAYRLQQSGSDIVVLKIKTDVALLKGTLFSDINAADKLHTHGGELDDLKRVNFNATKRNYVRKDDVDFKPHQAEVMVKTFIPLRFIVNLKDEVKNKTDFHDTWNSLSKEWKTVLKCNIFSWFNEEESKIINRNYDTNNIDEEPWYNLAYQMTEYELKKIQRIKYLSTVIPDYSPWGGAEYTPNLDLGILDNFSNIEYLDISCYGCYEGNNWNQFISRCPIMENVKTLRCILNGIINLDFIIDKFPNIQELNCSCNNIEKLYPLYNLNLKKLDCSDNRIPQHELEEFQKKRPLCEIGPFYSGLSPLLNTFELNK